MKLLIFAHRGEAQAFFDKWAFRPINFFFNGLFESKDYLLLLTGEGLKEASEKTVAVLSKYHGQIDEIINIGIAGSLSPKLKMGDLIWVRSSYATNVDKCEFKSFNTQSKSSFDCISSHIRVTDNEQKKKLSSFADMVDRELWSIMSAAHLFKLQASSLKLISDESNSEDFCQIVKEEAPKLSRMLLEEFLKSQQTNTLPEESLLKSDATLLDFFTNNDDLYFTTSQLRKLQVQLKGFEVKKNITELEIKNLVQMRVNELKESKTAKEISKQVLIDLDQRLNPLNALIKNKISQALKPLTDSGINVSTDPELENQFIQINYQIKSERDLKKLILALSYFNMAKIKDIFDGNFDHDV